MNSSASIFSCGSALDCAKSTAIEPGVDSAGGTVLVMTKGTGKMPVPPEVGFCYASPLIRRRVPCFDPIGQSMHHPDASGMKHGTP